MIGVTVIALALVRCAFPGVAGDLSPKPEQEQEESQEVTVEAEAEAPIVEEPVSTPAPPPIAKIKPKGKLTNFNYNNDVGTRDWLCRGVQEWTITRVSYDVQDDVFEIYSSCNVGSEDSIGYWGNYDDVPTARPVMYLKQGTKIDFTHAGTSADPYRIS